MDFFVEVRGRHSEQYKKLIGYVLPSMIKQLKLEKFSKTLMVVVDKSVPESGSTYPNEINGCYVIALKPATFDSIGITLGHELTHVAQLMRGTLKKLPDGAHIWAGKKYSKKTKYMDQPWELQAFAKQEILFRRALEV